MNALSTQTETPHVLTFPKVTWYSLIDLEISFWICPRVRRILTMAWKLRKADGKQGVFDLAHAHLDRASTDRSSYIQQWFFDPSTMTLSEKQEATEDVSRLAYTRASIQERVKNVLEYYIQFGVAEFSTFVNVWVTLPEEGMGVLKWMEEVKQEYADRIAVNLISYPMFWFRDDKPERWTLLETSIESGLTQWIWTLPERDEAERHIGYKANVERTVLYALKHQKPVYIHVDQKNTPDEDGSERILEVISSIEAIYNNPLLKDYENPISQQKEPFIWLVHAISPSCYDEARFQRLAKKMAKYNIGVIVCPSAAISMKQESWQESRIHNSIARVIDFLKYGIHVKMWVDNIWDLYLPMTWDPLYEVRLLADATRCYDKEIIAHIIAGKRISRELQETLKKKYK